MSFPSPALWSGREVLVTGHTGFKGAWLCLWLARLGARVHGYALPPAAGPEGEASLFEAAGVRSLLASHCEADLRDRGRLARLWRESGAAVLFHLAAQPLVREGYRRPYETFEVNVLGTAAVLEALRLAGRPAAAVLVTTDKCYENFEEVWGRRETDPLGGHDPYSASKAGAELAAAAWRRSFFPGEFLKEHGVRVATARGGNVVGGGDWAADRLVPDLARAALAGRKALVRNPNSVRPWQHVLDCLAGYLLLAERLLAEPFAPRWCSAWNFGPEAGDIWPVGRLADSFGAAWGPGAGWRDASEPGAPPETGFLSLCIDKARRDLGWRPRWSTAEAVERTAAWYKASARPGFQAAAACGRDVRDYEGAES
jgi:CDP-glucose 4,6-dehydratase